MRSLFSASAIMLMAFSYLQISSGMSTRDRRKGKSVIPSGQDPLPSVREAKPKLNLKLVQIGKGKRQLYNEETGEYVGGVYHGNPDTETDSSEIGDSSLVSDQLDIKGRVRKFSHELVRFEGDKPYKKGTPSYRHALRIQWDWVEHCKKIAANNPENTLAPRTDQQSSGLTWMQRYQNYKRTDGLLPEIPEPVAYETDMRHELIHNPFLSTPRARMPSGVKRSSFNPGQHDVWNQPAYNQLGSTLHHEQPSVGGFNQGSFIQPQPFWDPQGYPYANTLNAGPAEVLHPTAGLPPNPLFSESSDAHNFNQNSNWHYGPGNY